VPLYSAGRSQSGAFLHVDSLDALFGHLRITTALAPQVADRLAVGTPSPLLRLPVLVCLLVMIAALTGVTALQLQRQHNFVRLRSEFVAGVSHELRTPLAQIRLLAELLRMGRPLTEANRERSLQIIDQEARRLSYLVENVLAFSRPRADAGLQSVTLRPTSLRSQVETTLDAFRPLASSRRSELCLTPSPDIVVALDEDAFRQILINLLDNAVRYGRSGQTVQVVLEAHGNRALVIVEDEGFGVPASQRDQIWEPYVRLPRDEGGAQGGTGLGLAVVEDLVARHGGEVWVEDSHRGSGARFVVAFPIVTGAGHPTLPASTDSTPAREVNV
jgi:signal transduction histidine kinase